MFEVKSEQELINLLKIIAEEAVHSSKKSLNESSDSYSDDLETRIDHDKKLFTEEEGLDQEEDLDDESNDDSESGEPPMPAKEKAKSFEMSAEDFGASFDSVVTAINTLRAGRSLKDSQIRDETSKYYDGLSEDERKVLLVFLNSLSQILTGAIKGSKATDPSDPPLNLKIGKSKEAPSTKPPPAQQLQAKPQQKTTASSASREEDTSPPIRVNEIQDTKFLRTKIRKLMNS